MGNDPANMVDPTGMWSNDRGGGGPTDPYIAPNPDGYGSGGIGAFNAWVAGSNHGNWDPEIIHGGGGKGASISGQGGGIGISFIFVKGTVLPEVYVTKGKADWQSWGKTVNEIYGQSLGWDFRGYGENNWYGTGNQINWFFSSFATGVANTHGSFRLSTSNQGISPKYYPNSWTGNKYAKTYNIGKVGGILGKASFGLGVVMDAVGVGIYVEDPTSINAVHPAKAGLNTGMGALGVWGNPAIGMIYFGIDAFYPGGWPGALNNMDQLQRANQEVLGPTWRLFPYNKF